MAKHSGQKSSKSKASARKRSQSRRHISRPTTLPTDELILVGLPEFSKLRPTQAQLDEFERSCQSYSSGLAAEADPQLGCVVRLDRGFPVVACEQKTGRCEFGQGLSSLKTNERVAIGDWVVAWWPEGHDMGVVDAILPRESDIARWRGKSRGDKQTLAANVDVVIVAQALSEKPLLLDRIARTLVVAYDCGAEAAVVLTKADRCPDAAWLLSELARVRDVVGPNVSVVVSAAVETDEKLLGELKQATRAAHCVWGVDAARQLVPEARVGMVIGESGAGKSTLLNALFGDEVLETGTVRESDDEGRHTTVARRMVSLPDAGIIVDAPGLRSLPLLGHERGLAQAFPEIVAFASSCRFNDCTHGSEPGCAVRQACENGEFSSAALEAYLALAHEMRNSINKLDPDIVI